MRPPAAMNFVRVFERDSARAAFRQLDQLALLRAACAAAPRATSAKGTARPRREARGKPDPRRESGTSYSAKARWSITVESRRRHPRRASRGARHRAASRAARIFELLATRHSAPAAEGGEVGADARPPAARIAVSRPWCRAAESVETSHARRWTSSPRAVLPAQEVVPDGGAVGLQCAG